MAEPPTKLATARTSGPAGSGMASGATPVPGAMVSGFGGMNGQSMQNAAVMPQFQPPPQPFQPAAPTMSAAVMPTQQPMQGPSQQFQSVAPTQQPMQGPSPYFMDQFQSPYFREQFQRFAPPMRQFESPWQPNFTPPQQAPAPAYVPQPAADPNRPRHPWEIY